MTDLADISNGFITAAAAILFPAGGYVPGTVATSAFGMQARLYRGWPDPAELDIDARASISNVTVFADPGVSRNTTRYLPTWQTASQPAATITATVAGLVVTIGGTGGAGQVVGLAIGNGITRTAYSYRLSATDTPATVAAGLSGLIPSATAAGAILTLASGPAEARIGVDAVSAQVARSQTQRVSLHCWCPSPDARDALAGGLDAAMVATTRLTMPDGTVARITYAGTREFDRPGIAGVWRRDLTWIAEYVTAQSETQPAVLWPGLSLGIPVGSDGNTPDILTPVGPGGAMATVFMTADGQVVIDAAGNLLGAV